MRWCHLCGKILEEIPFTCPRCGHDFCFGHHLPENHDCLRLHQYDHKPHLRVCRNCGRELKQPAICHRCGKVLCDHCRLPENHLCLDKSAGSSPGSRSPG